MTTTPYAGVNTSCGVRTDICRMGYFDRGCNGATVPPAANHTQTTKHDRRRLNISMRFTCCGKAPYTVPQEATEVSMTPTWPAG